MKQQGMCEAVMLTFLQRGQQQMDTLCNGVWIIMLHVLQQTNKKLLGAAGLEK